MPTRGSVLACAFKSHRRATSVHADVHAHARNEDLKGMCPLDSLENDRSMMDRDEPGERAWWSGGKRKGKTVRSWEKNKAVYTTAPVADGREGAVMILGRGSNGLGRGSNDLGRGSNDLGRGMLKYELFNP